MKFWSFLMLIFTLQASAQSKIQFEGYYLEIGFVDPNANGFVSHAQYLFPTVESMVEAIKDPRKYYHSQNDSTQMRLFNHNAFIYEKTRITPLKKDSLDWINYNANVSLYRGNDYSAHSIYKLVKDENVFFYAKRVEIEIERRIEEVVIGAKWTVLPCQNKDWYLLRVINKQELLELNKEPLTVKLVEKVSLKEALEKYHPCINKISHEHDTTARRLWIKDYLFPDY